MSKSLKRVTQALIDAGLHSVPAEMPAQTRTAAQAADAIGCAIDQIAKSIIFASADTGVPILFITAGGQQVDTDRATELAGIPLVRADAAIVRKHTGFAIGGVAPIGHINPVRSFFDRSLLKFETIYAAAGTPHHIFPISPTDLLKISGAEVSDFIDTSE